MPSFFVGRDEFGHPKSVEVEAYDIMADDLAKRVRVFAGLSVLGNPKVTVAMGLRCYQSICMAAIKKGRWDYVIMASSVWWGFIKRQSVEWDEERRDLI